MAEFTINIAHLPDREYPVAEVWHGHAQFAEVSCEAGGLVVEIYPSREGKPWRFSFDEIMRALEQARTRLADVTGAVFR